jgi:hypothetical protein
VQTAKAASNDVALSVAVYVLGGTLLSRDAVADRNRGLELMKQVRDMWLRRQIALQMLPKTEVWVARETARRGDHDAAIAVMRDVVDELYQAGRIAHGVWCTGALVETLLERGAEGDLTEAEGAIDRLANLPADKASAIVDITLLRLCALLARARGDDVGYKGFANRYQMMAKSLGFEGHIAVAESMIEAVL